MATLHAIFSFFTLHILVLIANANGDPLLEVLPPEISLGTSSSLDINCSFFPIDHPEMAEFSSLILSRANSSDDEFENLAAITKFLPDSVTVLTDEKLSATGVHSQTGESFLHLTWAYPTATQSGVYKCTAYGLHILGGGLKMVTTSAVTVDEADLIDVFEKLKQMEILDAAMGNKMSEMEEHIQALEYNNSQMSSYITDLEDAVASLRPIVDLNFLGTYDNSDYYVSSVPLVRIDIAMVVCKFHGGYLVEIDNENEFNAMKELLSKTSGFEIAMIAGTDEAADGTWILQSSQKPVPFTRWYTSGASKDINANCLGMVRFRSWDMDDFYCNHDKQPTSNFRFTCEIPHV